METTPLRSHGDAAVELLDLLFEELFELRPLSFQRRGQEAVLDGKHLVVDVDVLHLQIETPAGKLDLLSITSQYFKKPRDWLIVAVFRFFYCESSELRQSVMGLPAQRSGGHWLCPDVPDLPGWLSSPPVEEGGGVQTVHHIPSSCQCAGDPVVLHPPTVFLQSSW